MKLKKSILPVVLASGLILTSTSYGIGFKDVKTTDWYVGNVNKLVDKGGIKGYEDGTFRPNGTITKAEFVAMTLRSMGYTPENVAGAPHWAAGVFKKAQDIGLLKGGELNMYVDSPINRYEMALVVTRALEVKKENIPNDYKTLTDALSDYAKAPDSSKEFVAKAYAMGIISGYPDRTFGGTKTLTRAEASAVVMRIIDATARVAVVKPAGKGQLLVGETKTVEQMFSRPLDIKTVKSPPEVTNPFVYETITLGEKFPYQVWKAPAQSGAMYIHLSGGIGYLIAITNGEIVRSAGGFNDSPTSMRYRTSDENGTNYDHRFEQADYWGLLRFNGEKNLIIYPNPMKK